MNTQDSTSVIKVVDRDCRGPHKVGQRLLKWQHSDACKRANAKLFRKNGSEISSLQEDATIVERGRAFGAI